jgi:hypothetical protein
MMADEETPAMLRDSPVYRFLYIAAVSVLWTLGTAAQRYFDDARGDTCPDPERQ